jgi:hypothetical protein
MEDSLGKYLLNDIRERIKIPRWVLDYFYQDNKQIDHFYSDEEKKNFYKKWEKNIT